MAYLSPFENDIFISYARVDDEAPPDGGRRWVTYFEEQLSFRLRREFVRAGSVTIWRDKREVAGNDYFDKAIQESINSSALFLALISNGYLEQQSYCHKELDWFSRKAQSDRYGLTINHCSRIFNVRLQNIPPADWPEPLAGMEGFKFHDDRRVSQPLPPGDIFNAQIDELFSELVLTLRAFKPLVEQRLKERQAAETPAAGSQTVFMAHAEGPLRTHRRRAIEELRRNSVNVITDIPPPYGLVKHEEKVSDVIEKADLSVHLLEEAPGIEIEDAPEKFYYREQVEIGKRRAKSQLIWAPKTLNIPDIDDEAHRNFLAELEGQAEASTYKFVREAPTRIAPVVLAQLELLKRAAKPSGVSNAASNSVALLDIHRDDSSFVQDLSPVFIEEQVELRITPEGDGPRTNLSRFEDSLKQASVLIIIFGRVAADWVSERIVSVQQFFVKEECPLKLCGVYIPPVNGSNADRQFDCVSRNGPLRVARIKTPEELRTLLRVFI
jgi:hypothetical protein